MKDMILEICAGDLDSVKAAVEGGADRVELCCALSEGGLTPSASLMKAANALPILVNVLIRPRSGDFVYDADEVAMMIDDIKLASSIGCNGVVIGALLPNGDIDIEACKAMADAVKGMSLTFHRAFDMCRNPEEALSQLIDLGFDRILTSGCADSAMEGRDMLARLVEMAGDRISIMAGSGVSPSNVVEIVESTGVSEVHASARASVKSRMEFRRDNVNMGKKGEDEYSRLVTSADIVKEIKNQI